MSSKGIPIIMATLAIATSTACVCAQTVVPTTGDVRATGGLRPSARILTVTSLDDDGPGTLRAAMTSPGPRVIVFQTSGLIRLKSDLILQSGQVTIAGETAPSPGIVLTNGTLAIRASDVVISHLAIYAGANSDPKIAENRDALNLYGSPGRNIRITDVVLRNISLGWGIDENLGIQGDTDGLKIERALITQPLRNAGHPKGIHSMNLLLGNRAGRVIITGSILASSEQRSPRLTQGNRVSFFNNLIYGPGRVATHIDSSKEVFNAGAIDIVGNVYQPNADTKCRQPFIRIDQRFFDREPKTSIHLADNVLVGEHAKCLKESISVEASALSPARLTQVPGWNLAPARAVVPKIFGEAGAHPAARNPIDARAIREIRDGTMRIINTEADVGGVPAIPVKTHKLDFPVRLERIDTAEDAVKVRAWLCTRHQAVSGGLACPR